MTLKRVVVTGLGAITPLGNTATDYWNGLVKGVSGAGIITRFNAENFKTKFACEVKDFNPEDYLERKEIRKYDLFTIFALVATDEAIKDSGIDLEIVDKDRVGVILGSGIGGFNTFLTEVGAYFKGDGTPRFNPFFIPKLIPDIAGGREREWVNLGGQLMLNSDVDILRADIVSAHLKSLKAPTRMKTSELLL